MARWIGAVFCLLVVNAASAQIAAQPREIPPPVIQVDLFPTAVGADPFAPPTPPIPQAPAVQGFPVTPPVPYEPNVFVQRTTLDVVEEPPLPLEIVVYSVADLVVGQDAGADANQALLSMLAQQSEELAMALNAAAAGGGESQQHTALNELAETIRSTFAAEFQDERASITLHRGTMSLIVRQSDAVHVQIRDLLDQLRHANNTSINVSIELVELDEARTPFAMAHNGQVLDDAAAAEFRALAEQGEAEQLKFNVTVGNGQSMSMLASGLPGTMTAVASHDRREVRLLLDMMLGMEMGMTQKFNHRIPAGESLLTIFTCDGSGYVVLLSAEIEGQEELDNALFGPEDATLLPATHAEPAPPSEPVSQTPPTQILTQSLLVEVDSLPDDFLEQLVERFECVAIPDRDAILLGAVTSDDLVRALAKENRVRVLSRPQIISLNGEGGEIQVGQQVPVMDGIIFENDLIVPLARNQEVGTRLNILPTAAADGCIELQLVATRTKILDEETVLYSAPGQTITSPIVDTVEARTTFTVPEGKTLVWPVPPIGGAEAEGSTLLIFLKSNVVGDADREE